MFSHCAFYAKLITLTREFHINYLWQNGNLHHSTTEKSLSKNVEKFCGKMVKKESIFRRFWNKIGTKLEQNWNKLSENVNICQGLEFGLI